ncbi:YitT family protein [Paenibacillus flagellatus]|uniref:DUF2179 domain-containing protein n=1 Tax=Paenibacillus flagellatus TaxID=2211139 RepID=A0A2V5K3F4_9BACL|nr:YitT family protein [Paenibacillus flagellatus]PYI53785.1 hypothetical protein DLM86_14585 [Paenibacillus flagellatus]
MRRGAKFGCPAGGMWRRMVGGAPAAVSFCAGIALIAVGLELFLKPNRLVAGGTQGISIVLSHVTEMRMGLLLLALNVPFLFLKRPGSGLRSVLARTAALGATAAAALALEPVPPLTEHALAASVLGGLAIGSGAGLVLRVGAYTDGLRETAFRLRPKVPLSAAELVALFHLAVLALAGFAFGWERALYSAIAYYAAYKSLEATVRRFRRHTMVVIRSGRPHDVRTRLTERLGGDVTFLRGPHASAAESDCLVAIVARERERALREEVRGADPAAELTATAVEGGGGRHEAPYGP